MKGCESVAVELGVLDASVSMPMLCRSLNFLPVLRCMCVVMHAWGSCESVQVFSQHVHWNHHVTVIPRGQLGCCRALKALAATSSQLTTAGQQLSEVQRTIGDLTGGEHSSA